MVVHISVFSPRDVPSRPRFKCRSRFDQHPHEHLSEEENITKEACIKANADGATTELPQGYDIMVGALCLEILLLGEVTSVLDTQSAQVVQDATDCIYALGEGLVSEQGTHAGLLAYENGAYSPIVHAQKLRAEVKRVVEDEVHLCCKNTNYSVASDLFQERSQRRKKNEANEGEYNLPYPPARIDALNYEGLWRYGSGATFAVARGMVYPVFGIVRDATSKLRAPSLRAVLRQDIELFDWDVNSTSTSTANLSKNPRKINGLAGAALGAIVESISTLIGGSAIGLA
ncbi:hypothetical protein PAXRUDRAFT_14195 [Paxillus rubicundulus Ve08.2h10]|uniref:Uncharacterized protein n=1 Tax=Paxillus rubicundulus Ve08.2h10 TaxID=930991 RepID=A0A0D0DWW5_9AGAM|nr:hypothetical protein PAXRUDRAFT_14195 [Paxillus rubicundulus Ve08.2h10]